MRTPRARSVSAGVTAVTAVSLVASVSFMTATAAAAQSLNAPSRSQVSVDHAPTGVHLGTPNENEPRYSLSLTKLLIADYVFEHGSAADRDKASRMIRTSDDGLATELAGKYPDAIRVTADKYRMNSAVPADNWGNWQFSSKDWSKYLSAKLKEDPTATGPLLTAMRQSSTNGADGYNQRYGVALQPGVRGWKSGWSDDRTTYHASTGFGGGWTVAIQTNGTKGELNADLARALSGTGAFGPPAPDAAPGMTNWPARAVAQNAVDDVTAWVSSVDGSTGGAVAAGIENASGPVVGAVPQYIALPTVVADALPQAR